MKQQLRIPILCIAASVLLIMYHYEAQPAFFDAHLARRFTISPVNELYRYLYSFIATFVVLGLLPATAACVFWNEQPSEWGLTWGTRKLVGFAFSLALFIPLLFALAYASTLPSIRLGHPLSKLVIKHQDALVVYEACLFLYIAGLEFFFRGFLLFGIKRKFGDAAIYLQTLPYALMYIGKPQVEALAAIPAGIALGYLASRTGSVWYGIILHWLAALTLDIFVIYHLF